MTNAVSASRVAAALAVLVLAAGASAAESVTSGFHAATPASAAAVRRHAAAPLPAANFLVEWRLQPVDAAPARGGVVITSNSAATGTSGFGPGAVVVGTARPAPPQALRVANGKEGAIQFDRSETHTVWDMTYAASASARSSTDASAQVVSGAASSAARLGGSRARSQSQDSGVQGHEVVVHRIDGLRVTPHWIRGDTLELDVALTHVAPADPARGADAGARASRDIDLHAVVQASFDEWLTLASVGDGGEELQIRVSWR
jgi:hypothetical protein